jgi:hypothetical protein
MSYQVIDRDGNLIEVEDGMPVPYGCSLRVEPAQWFKDALDDMRRRQQDEADDDDDDDDDDIDEETDDDGDELTDAELAEQRRADAWDSFRASLDYRNRRKAGSVRAPAPRDPSYQRRVPWKPEGKYGNDAAPSDAEARRAAAYANFKAKLHTAGPNRARHQRHHRPATPPPSSGGHTSSVYNARSVGSAEQWKLLTSTLASAPRLTTALPRTPLWN